MGLLDDFKMPGMDTPEGQGLLSAAFSLMSAQKRPGQKGAFAGALGDAGQQYMQATNSSRDQMQRRKYLDAQMEAQKMQLETARQKQMADQKAEAERQRVAALISNAGRVAPGMGAGLSPADAGSLPPEFQIGANIPALQTPGKIDYQNLFRQGVPIDMLKGLSDSANLGKPKVQNIETVNVGGKPMKVGIDEYGQQVAQIGMEWRPLKTQDMGGYVGMFDETNPGAGITKLGDKTQSAESKASNALGWANNALTRRGQDLTDARSREGTWAMNNDTGYMVNSRTGEYRLATGPDGRPSDRPVKLTEVQGKATGFASRMKDAEETLNKFEDKVSPSGVAMAGYRADFPNWIPGGQILGGAITAANKSFNPLVSDEAMSYQQAQENWVTANLRLESGAVIGPEEMQKEIQKYFPQPGEPKSVADQKKAARAIAQRAVTAQAGPGVRLIPEIAPAQTPSPAAPFKDAGKEQRYQEWLRRNQK